MACLGHELKGQDWPLATGSVLAHRGGFVPAAWPSQATGAAHVSLFPLQFLCHVKSVRDQSCIPCEEMVGTATSRQSLELVSRSENRFVFIHTFCSLASEWEEVAIE